MTTIPCLKTDRGWDEVDVPHPLISLAGGKYPANIYFGIAELGEIMANLKRAALISMALLILATAQLWAAVTITGAGSTFAYPLYSKWAAAYYKLTGVRVNYASIGSGGGIQQLKAKTVDFGASDAPLSNEVMKSMPAPVVHIPTVAGAVAITYNVKGVGSGLRLDGKTIADIYLGKIRRWNDPAIKKLNPKLRLPAIPILVAHRSDGSGTSYIFTHYLAAVSSEWSHKVGASIAVRWPVGLGGKGSEGVTGIVKQAPGGIGYVELAYAVTNHLPYAVVRNSKGQFVKPTIASTAVAANAGVPAMMKDIRAVIVNSPAKNAYPISGFTYILIYKNQTNPTQARALMKFLRWGLRDGEKMAGSLLYVQLPPKVVALDEHILNGVTLRGKPIK